MLAFPWLGAYLLSSHQVPGSFLYPHSSCQPSCDRSPVEDDAQFNPAKRIASEEILYHPYLQAWHNPVDEPTRPAKFCFGPEDEDSIEGMKKLVVEEAHLFRAEIWRTLVPLDESTVRMGGLCSSFSLMRQVLTIPSASYVLPIPP